MRRLALALVLCAATAIAPASAGVTVIFDSAALNELLAASTVHEVQVPIAGTRTIRVLLENIAVKGLEPGGDGGKPDIIRTSLNVRVPSLGLNVPVEPRLALHVVRAEPESVLELRFEQLQVPLPLGAVDIAGLLPPMRYPADAVFQLAGAQENVYVRSRLTQIEMGRESLRFEFDLEALPPGQP